MNVQLVRFRILPIAVICSKDCVLFVSHLQCSFLRIEIKPGTYFLEEERHGVAQSKRLFRLARAKTHYILFVEVFITRYNIATYFPFKESVLFRHWLVLV